MEQLVPPLPHSQTWRQVASLFYQQTISSGQTLSQCLPGAERPVWANQSNVTDVLIPHKRKGRQTREWQVTRRQRLEFVTASQGMPGLPAAGGGRKGPPLDTSEWAGPADTLTADSSHQNCARIHFCCFYFCEILYSTLLGLPQDMNLAGVRWVSVLSAQRCYYSVRSEQAFLHHKT